MRTATAASTVTIGAFSGSGARVLQIDDALVRRYARFTSKNACDVYSSRLVPEAEVYRPRHISPPWLPEIEAIIARSVDDGSEPLCKSGQWLRDEVATAAIRFFQETADLLPGKPYVYGSKQGDLVAEFKAPRGTLTSVISPNFIILFSVVDDVPLHEEVLTTDDARSALTSVTKALLAGTHGDLATEK